MKCNNICVIGIPEGEEIEQGIENLFKKIMTENFPNLVRKKVIHVQEAQKVSQSKLNPKRPTTRHIIIKMAKFKDKERILNALRQKQLLTYKGTTIRLSADFSTETPQARRAQHQIFQVMESKDLQPRLLYPTRLSFKMESKIRNSPGPPNKKAERAHLHQTSITRETKGTTFRR
ncbi:hypothetical protein HJG60_008602 [Phyllostomus discolor]|uniref:L1 transposable element RRM domain-containing protein n=1 Tax=Phyllostomus discolor TaxID=89673 RepID=A0A833Z500_9CHIR|nr:hypothetical protein HJG60_008602 [Phyllostomus discolor]